MDLSVNVEHFDQNQRGESDHNDVRERVTEHEEAEHQDAGALEY